MLTIRDELRIRNIAHSIMHDAKRPFGSRFLDCSEFLNKMVRDGECSFQDSRIFLRDAELMAKEEVGVPEDEDYIILLHRRADNGIGEYITRHYHSFIDAHYEWECLEDLGEDWTANWSVFDNGTWRVIDYIQ